MEVGLSPGDFVLDGDPSPLQKGGGAPKFSAMFIVSCRIRVKRLYACVQIHYLRLVIIEFELNILGNSVTLLTLFHYLC